MNTKIYHSLYTLLVAGALLASGCSNDDDTYDFYAAHPDAVRFHITAGDAPQTRVNTEGDGTTFDVKDQIAISADGGTSYSTYVQSAGDDWLPAEGQRYLRWKEEELSFQAYYPVTEGTDYIHFTVPKDQRGQTNLRNADYMTALATNQSSASPVTLAFKHQLAKVTVSITMSEELTGETINLMIFYTKGRTLENGSITDGDRHEAYYPHPVGNSYMAILPPQSGDNSAYFIQLRLDSGREYTLTGIPALEPGKAYTLALQVGHEGIKQISPITVADWTTQPMTGGTATDLTIWDGKYPTSKAEALAWMGEETSGANDPTAANHVFTIKAARQLAALHYLMVNNVKLNGAQGTLGPNGMEGDGYNYATYNLAADIDLNNKSWEPIGVIDIKEEKPASFSGIFNGQGHTVSGMNIQKKIPLDYTFYAGFFSNILMGTVTSLNVQGNINVESSQYCGGIVGYHEGGTIAFCSFQGSIIASNDFEHNPCTVGGITGLTFNTDAKIISCYSVFSRFDVTAPTTRKGSIAGQLGENCTIQGCYWQKLTELDDTKPYGFSESSVIVENNGTFTNAAGANAVVNTMNQYDADYDYHWQAATDGGYPVLVKKQS